MKRSEDRRRLPDCVSRQGRPETKDPCLLQAGKTEDRRRKSEDRKRKSKADRRWVKSHSPFSHSPFSHSPFSRSPFAPLPSPLAFSPLLNQLKYNFRQSPNCNLRLPRFGKLVKLVFSRQYIPLVKQYVAMQVPAGSHLIICLHVN